MFGNVCDDRTVLPSHTFTNNEKSETHERNNKKSVTDGRENDKSYDLSFVLPFVTDL
jgi:hypothetical protein